MKRFGAVVVLYQPTAQQLDNLRRTHKQCEDLVAVDNTPEPDPGMPAALAGDGIEVVVNRNAGGIAGGLNRGMERLAARGCEVLFGFDQDSQLPDGYFTTMMRVCTDLGQERFIVGPRIFDVYVERYLDSFIADGFRARRVAVAGEREALLPCSFVISSGCAVSARTFRELGPLREDFFIDHVDTEYCLRAQARGIPIYITTAVTLRHQIGKRVKHRFLFFFEIGAMDHPPLRRYYLARNALSLVRLYGRRFPLVILINLLTLGQLIAVLCYETDKRRKLAAIRAGLCDGLRGRAGSFQSRCPQLAGEGKEG